MTIVQTLLVVLEQFFVHFPLVFAAYLSMSLMKIPDLSIESAFVFGALCASQTVILFRHLPFYVHFLFIFLIALVSGACIGLTSGMLTRFAHFPHLLSSIITFGIFHGINQFVAPSYVSLSNTPNYLSNFALIPSHPEFFSYLLITLFIIVFGLFFCQTQIGYALAAFGQNHQFFTHYGISTTYIFMTGIIISNAFAGLSGYLFAQTNGFAEINMGFGKTLFCVSSIILGKQIYFRTRELSIAIPIVGGLAYFALQQLLLNIHFDSKYFTMAQSILLLIILLSKRNSKKQTSIQQLGI